MNVLATSRSRAARARVDWRSPLSRGVAFTLFCACGDKFVSDRGMSGVMCSDNQDLFYADIVGNSGDYRVVRKPLGGGDAVALPSFSFQPRAILSDGQSVYVSGFGLLAFDVAGTSVRTLIPGASATLGGPLAMDQANVYSVAELAQPLVFALVSESKSGGGLNVLGTGIGSFPTGLAVNSTMVVRSEWGDSGGTELGGFFASQTDRGRVASVLLNGSGSATFSDAEAYPDGVALDDTTVFWIDDGDTLTGSPGAIKSAPLAGGDPTVVTFDQLHFNGCGGFAYECMLHNRLRLDGDMLYWADNTTIHRMPKIGGAVETVLDVGTSSGHVIREFAITASAIYWLDTDGIGQIAK